MALGLIAGCDEGGESGPVAPNLYEPSGAMPWVTGTTRDITWWADPSISQVSIELHDTDTDGAPVLTIAASTDAAAGTYPWLVSAPAPGVYYVRIADAANTWRDRYSEPFEIVDPGIHVSAPAAGDPWKVGDTEAITWYAEAATEAGVSQVKIEISRNNGGSWGELSASTDASLGTFDWAVTDGGLTLPQAECIVRVSDAASVVASADSGQFTIFSGVWYVSPSGDGSNGLTWPTAFQHPQDAMDAARPGNEIWVAEGSYTFRAAEDIVVLAMRDGVAIYGGFAGTESLRTDRDWTTHTTTLDGAGTALHVVTAASESVMDGFEIAWGNAEAYDSSYVRDGGGLHGLDVSDLAIRNCVFHDNVAILGAGLDLSGSDVSITDCRFVDNAAAGSCGGARLRIVSLQMKRCVFVGNIGSDAGGVAIGGSNGEIENCVFVGNTATVSGGGVYVFRSTASVANCTVSSNHANLGSGGGVYAEAPYTANITGSILWGNTAPTDPHAGGCAITYSDVEGGHAGIGNIDTDPLVVDAAGGDYHLQATSPCIDAADPATTLTEDIEGNPRPAGSGYDMGAYEYQP